jgi:hypothetical protein
MRGSGNPGVVYGGEHERSDAAGCCRESEGVPRLNSLESLFDKEGLREFGVRRVRRLPFMGRAEGRSPTALI